jgi:iron complex outermembrane recepter protein
MSSNFHRGEARRALPSHHGLLSLAALAAALALPATAALAQAADQGDDATAEIVVTAQRRSEGIQKVPISMQAFSQDSLTNLGINSTDAIQFATPGFVNTSTSGDGISGAFIRGVGTGYSGPGLEGSVAFYLDDVYLQTQTGAAQAALDLEQIQVLKGPQGTLYGRNATGGAVVVTTKDPKLGVTEGYVKAGYGNLDWKRGEAVLNVPLADSVAFRVAGYYENRNGYVRNVAFPQQEKSGVGAGDTYGFRAKLLIEPNDQLRIVAMGSMDRRDGNGAIHSLRINPNGTPTGLGYFQTSQSLNREGGGGDDTSARMASLKVTYDLGEWEISNTAAYRRTRAFGCTDNDGVAAEILYFCTVSQRSPNPGDAHGKQDKTFTNEFRVVSDLDGAFNVTAGAFYERNKARFVGRVGGSSFGALTPTFDNHDNLTAYSGFLEVYYNITDKLKATGGLRYTHEKKYHSAALDADALILTAGFLPPFSDGKTSFSNTSPRFVLSYDAGSVNYYASFNRGFKSGGFNSPTFGVDPPLKPETISAYEVGAKYRSPDGRLRLTTAAFHYDWKNVQVAFITGGGAGIQQQNAAKARIRGAEASLDWNPDSSLTLNIGGAYTHGRYRSFPNAAVYDINPVTGTLAATAEDLKGFRLPHAPDWTASGSVTYRFDLPADWKGDITLAARTTSKYDYSAGGGGQLRAAAQPAFSLVNLSGTITTPNDRIELGWFITNLTDKKHVQLISTGDTGVYETPAEPRLYGVTAKYSF